MKIKFVCLLLIACMILPMTSMTLAQEETAGIGEAAEVLSVIGILDRDMDYSETVTRAEFARKIYEIMSVKGDVGVESSIALSDVSETHVAAEAIYTLIENGMMDRYWDNKFRPDENITAEQAVKALVILAKYETQAENQGGYPNGYWSVASQQQILRNVNAGINSSITWADFANLVYNTLKVNLMVLSSIENGNVSYNKDKTENLLSEYYDIYMQRGVITANHMSAIGGNKLAVAKNAVVIGGENYSGATVGAEKYLGYDVKFYYKENNDGLNEIVYLFDVENTNTVTTIDADDINSVTGRTISYTSNGAKRSYTVSKASDVVVNGRIAGYSSELMNITAGSISIVERANGIDLISVESITEYIVSSVNYSNGMVYEKYRNIPIDTENVDLIISQDGDIIDINGLAEWDVLEIAAEISPETGKISEDDRDAIYGTLVNDSVSGIVTEVLDDGIKIDDVYYEYSKAFARLLATNSMVEPPQLGEGYKIALSSRGKIAAGEPEDAMAAKKYAILLKAARDVSQIDEIEIKLFTSEGNVEIYELPDEIVLDSAKQASSKILDAWEDLKLVTEEGVKEDVVRPENRMISYKTNEEGVIVEIDTLLSDRTSTKSELKRGPTVPLGGDAYKYKGGMMGTFFRIGTSTVRFVIPKYPEQDIDEVKNYDVGDAAFRDATDYDWFRGVYSYDATEDNLVSVAAVVPKNPATNQAINVDAKLKGGIILKKGAMLDEEGEAGDVLHIFTNEGKIINVFIADEDGYDPMQCAKNPWLDEAETVPNIAKSGDYIRYSTDSEGKLNGLEVALRISELGKAPANNVTSKGATISFGNQSYMRVAYGQAYYMDSGLVVAKKATVDGQGNVVYDYDDVNNSFDTYSFGSMKIYKYNRNTNNISHIIKEATRDDIQTYKKCGGDASMVLNVSFDANCYYILIVE